MKNKSNRNNKQNRNYMLPDLDNEQMQHKGQYRNNNSIYHKHIQLQDVDNRCHGDLRHMNNQKTPENYTKRLHANSYNDLYEYSHSQDRINSHRPDNDPQRNQSKKYRVKQENMQSKIIKIQNYQLKISSLLLIVNRSPFQEKNIRQVNPKNISINDRQINNQEQINQTRFGKLSNQRFNKDKNLHLKYKRLYSKQQIEYSRKKSKQYMKSIQKEVKQITKTVSILNQKINQNHNNQNKINKLKKEKILQNTSKQLINFHLLSDKKQQKCHKFQNANSQSQNRHHQVSCFQFQNLQKYNNLRMKSKHKQITYKEQSKQLTYEQYKKNSKKDTQKKQSQKGNRMHSIDFKGKKTINSNQNAQKTPKRKKYEYEMQYLNQQDKNLSTSSKKAGQIYKQDHKT